MQPALHILHARRGLDWLPRAGLLTDEELVRLITIAVTRGPGSSFTRITGPASAPGVATTLYSRFVGVTAGLGVPSTLTWNGSSSTAPDTPAGLASTATTNADTRATICVQPGSAPGQTNDHPPGAGQMTGQLPRRQA